MARIVQFFDGAQSETTPTIGNIKASGLIEYADDAAYEAAEQGSPAEGNIYFNTTSNLIRYYNGTNWINVVDENSSQTLTNKSIDGDDNTLTDISLPSLKTVLADANKFIVRNSLGQVVSLKTVPNGEVVGTTDSQVLTNKTIDADQNTISNIENADIKSGAAIDATKLADGSVSNTELQYINSLTSNAQDQLDSKIPLSQKGAINGIAELDSGGKVPASQLPSYVDDVLEYANLASFPVTGETGKIYVALDNGKQYRWTGSIYVEISPSEVNSVNGYTGIVNLALNDLSDVTTTAPSNGQIIQYNGSEWVNVTPSAGVTTLDGLTDVTITSPVTGQKLQYNGSQWVNITDNLNSLTDVDTTTTPPVNGNGLIYNGSQWVPANPTVTFTPPTVQKFLSGSGTYTTPTSPTPLYIRVKMIGGGGGGAGGGTQGTPGSGSNGGNTTFGSSLLVANGGSGAIYAGLNGGAGGTASLGSGPIGINVTGAYGGTGARQATTGGYCPGGAGAVTQFGGGAPGGIAGAGVSALANTGGGGGGGSPTPEGGNRDSGPGGGGGGYIDAIIALPSASYSYSVGTGGAGGAAGTSGNAGGSGGSGIIIVTEYYQ